MFIKEGLELNPQIMGGGQEKNLRAGTENISGIAAMGLALEIATKNMIINHLYIKELENQFFMENFETPPNQSARSKHSF